MEVLFESRGCRKLLQKNPTLKQKICEGLERQAENNFFKTKIATRKKWHNQTVYECRVNDQSLGAVRIAFTRKENVIHVLYGSTTLLKKAFSQELEKFLKEG
ncbi:hypothetical protein C815_00282 [Firmicutes bacterium M10-2]|nr:hypothetical protein C815_00282 [Firmicutes bacterium M10-2]